MIFSIEFLEMAAIRDNLEAQQKLINEEYKVRFDHLRNSMGILPDRLQEDARPFKEALQVCHTRLQSVNRLIVKDYKEEAKELREWDRVAKSLR